MSSTEWGGDYIKATVELMKVVAANNKLLFVNSPITIAEVIGHLRGKKKVDLKRALGLQNRLQVVALPEGGQVYVLTPPVGLTINFLPSGKIYNMLLGFNGWQVRRSAKKALRKLQMKHDLIHFVGFNPGLGLINGRKFNEKSLIYHCYDEMKGLSAWVKKHGVGLENAFIPKTDGVIVTSKNLLETKTQLNSRCYMVPNAVNYKLFSQGFTDRQNHELVIGYVGSVDSRIDYSIVEHLATHLPNARLVFVGRIVSQQGAAVLSKYKNIEVVGAKTPSELPAYLKTFSVGIIPFVKDMLTDSIYPLKVNEYLAAGLPVVSTNFGEMSDFNEVAAVAPIGDKEAFLNAINNEVAVDNPEKRQARQAFAKQNTWHYRAEQLSAAIAAIEAGI